MAGIPVVRYSSNPVDWTLVDGISVDEQRPPGGIFGIPGNKVVIVAQFERGPVDTLLNFGSSENLRKTLGDLGPDASGAFYEGALSIRAKRWGRLYAIRVSNGTQATAFVDLADSGVLDVLKVTADSLGNWGNSLKAEIKEATSGVANEFDLEITRDGVRVEIHRNLDLANATDANALPGVTSNYVVVTRIEIGAGRPETVAATALATGLDGSFADADYVGVPSPATGIEVLYGDAAGDIRWVFAGEQNSVAVNNALEQLAANGQQKNVILTGPEADTAALAITNVASVRSDRIGYAYPHVKIFVPEQQTLNGGDGLVTVSPVSFIANVLAHLAPGQNPAGPNGVNFLKGIIDLTNPNLTNINYEDFRREGIMGLQFTKEADNYEIRSGINTSLDSALHNWARRNMADFIQVSAAQFLVTFRNAIINDKNKLEIKTALTDFLDRLIVQGLLPNERDLNSNRPEGTAKLKTFDVDIASANTPQNEAEGIFVVEVRVRIFATMDFIVFRTEIGERVEINAEGF